MSFAHVVLVGSGVGHLDQAYTYRIPEHAEVHMGSVVRVPVRGKLRNGVVVELLDESDVARTQPIKSVLGPGLNDELVALCRHVADTCLSSFGEALGTAVPPRIASEEKREQHPPRTPRPEPDAAWTGSYTGAAQMLDAIADGRYRGYVWGPLPDESRGDVLVSMALQALQRNTSAIIVLPEVRAYTSVATTLVQRLGEHVAWLGSDRSDRERYRAWLALRRGDVRIAAGGRGAVFAPVRDLGLVVVYDDNHISLKEKRAPRYRARSVAAHRAREAGATLVVVGASAEVQLALRRRLLKPVLHTAHHAVRPAVVAVDRTKADDRHVPNARTLAALRRALDEGRRAVLLVHRTGEEARRIVQRTERVLATPATWLDAKAARDPDAFERASREARLIIASPVIAKDVALENIRCVAVVDADAALAVPEFRAAEEALETWGRVGRWLDRTGVLVVETAQPRHPAIAGLVRWSTARFWRDELARREELGYPPFATLVRVDAPPERMRSVADEITRAAPQADLLGPAEREGRAALVVRSRDRQALLTALHPLAARWRAGGTDVRVDVDPVDVLP